MHMSRLYAFQTLFVANGFLFRHPQYPTCGLVFTRPRDFTQYSASILNVWCMGDISYTFDVANVAKVSQNSANYISYTVITKGFV